MSCNVFSRPCPHDQSWQSPPIFWRAIAESARRTKRYSRRVKTKLVAQMQSYVAETCIGSSALRNQGGSGLIAASREFFKSIDFVQIPSTQDEFDKWLGEKTRELLLNFPVACRPFGAARKALNLFLRSAAYNIVLNRASDLDRLLPLLELPLDSFAANHLKTLYPSLPKKWIGLKYISSTEHTEYQQAAQKIAARGQVHRVDLDVFFYRENHRQ